MAKLWRERRFRFLLNIIDGLPRASHLGQANADDETQVTGQKASGVWRPSVRHHDEHAVILTAIHAVLENSLAVQADKYRPAFIPPPLTASDRVRARVAQDQFRKLSNTLFPNG